MESKNSAASTAHLRTLFAFYDLDHRSDPLHPYAFAPLAADIIDRGGLQHPTIEKKKRGDTLYHLVARTNDPVVYYEAVAAGMTLNRQKNWLGQTAMDIILTNPPGRMADIAIQAESRVFGAIIRTETQSLPDVRLKPWKKIAAIAGIPLAAAALYLHSGRPVQPPAQPPVPDTAPVDATAAVTDAPSVPDATIALPKPTPLKHRNVKSDHRQDHRIPYVSSENAASARLMAQSVASFVAPNEQARTSRTTYRLWLNVLNDQTGHDPVKLNQDMKAFSLYAAKKTGLPLDSLDRVTTPVQKIENGNGGDDSDQDPSWTTDMQALRRPLKPAQIRGYRI